MATPEPVALPVPGSKSVTHRAFILGALSSVPCRVEGPLMGADCRSTLAVLGALGARFTIEEGAVQFSPAALRPTKTVLDCGNSGTTLRLMSGQVARLGGRSTLTGDASLQSRPNGPLLAALERAGARTTSVDGKAPLSIDGPISAGEWTLPPRVSSQYASALALAGALLPGDSRLDMASPVASRPYLDITREVAEAFGVKLGFVDRPDGGLDIEIPGGQRPAAERYAVEGDWSGSAFPLVAGAIAERAVRLTGLRFDSAQGDRAIAELTGRFGPVLAEREGILSLDPRPLKAPTGAIDLGPCPDLFPPLVALAACAEGTTTFVGAPSLRHKECDRIAAMAHGLTRLGIECRARPDGIVVQGGAPKPTGEVIESHHDHRIHMAFSILIRCLGLDATVDGRGCEAVSYPDFHLHLERIAGRARAGL